MPARPMDLRGMTPEEIVRRVESGEIDSGEYASFTEYVKAMES